LIALPSASWYPFSHPALKAVYRTRMSSDLMNLEASYVWSEKRCSEAPTEKNKKDLAKKQILIDQLRRDKKWATRWFTSEELDQLGDDADIWPTEPRKPLSLSTGKEPSEVDDAAEMDKLVDVVEWNGYTTLTLDSVIAMLEKMREKYGGKMPVMGVEFGGFSALGGVQEDSGCLVIE
jgi:hypothetical protein